MTRAPGSEEASRAATLPERLESRWREEGWTRPGDRVVVAVSGGLDSTVLLHLLRFPLAGLALQLVVAHFDHRMRPGSAGDLAWVRGLTGAWRIPLRVGSAPRVPSDEGEARVLRYDFLHRVREEEEGAPLLTAHHARDQVETILFRLVRGTGVRGLAGMPQWREPGVLRPLLQEEPEILMAYAHSQGLAARLDPTNQEMGPARNRIRHRLLPVMEEIHPGARAALGRLGRNARRSSDALDHLLGPLMEELMEEVDGRRWIFRREGFLSHPPPVQAELLRTLLREAGPVPDEAGTARILEFIRRGSSGTGIHLAGGLSLTRHLDRIHLEPRDRDRELQYPAGSGGREPGSEPDGGRGEGPDRPFLLRAWTPPGRATAELAGRRYRIQWWMEELVAGEEPAAEEGPEAEGRDPAEEGQGRGENRWTLRASPEVLPLPLTLRRWEAGDRMRTPGGTKKLKKLFGEARIPIPERHRVPVLVGGDGQVVWIPGVARTPEPTMDDPDRPGVTEEGTRAASRDATIRVVLTLTGEAE